MMNASSNPSTDWTPQQKERLARSLERVARLADGLGHRVDKGIAQAVGMLNELGLHTSASCEGHVDWATGGPYIDIVSPRYREMKNKHNEMKIHLALEREAAELRQEMKIANAIEGRKALPILDDFYKTRTTSYEARIGLTFYGEAITRLESVGVAFLDAENDPAVKVRKLKEFQAEMKAFSDFLVSYEPAGAPFLSELSHKLTERQPPLEEGRLGSPRAK